MKLLTIENAKTSKGASMGYLTGILYLSPASLSGVNLCPYSTPGCRASCLNTAGRGRFDSIQQARLIKTLHWLNNPEGFIDQLADDIRALERKAKRLGLKPVVRLNGTSDIFWEIKAPRLFREFAHVQFYDYTKAPYNSRPSERLPANYSLTYSASEIDTDDALRYQLSKGRSVAAVFFDRLPVNVINGDEHDLRFLQQGQLIGLKAKGKAKHDRTGFVRFSVGGAE